MTTEEKAAESKPKTDVAVYKFRVPGWWVRKGKVPDVVETQLRMAHNLYNALTELQHAYDADKAAMWSSYPSIAEVEKRLGDTVGRIDELSAVVAKLRSQQRTRTPKGGVVDELRAASAEAKKLRVERRKAISTVRSGPDKEKVKARIDELTTALFAARKALYAEYVQEGRPADERVWDDTLQQWITEPVRHKLYWACFNQVVANHKVAAAGVDKKRAEGQPAAMRFRRWDGTGALAVQLQRQADDPTRSPELLASDKGKWRNVLQLGPWMPPEEFDAMSRGDRRRQAKKGWARIRVGSESVEMPLVIHRMLPADADVTDAKLVITRVAQRRRLHLCITVKMPERDPKIFDAANRTVAVHCGWRHESNDDIRVATWRSDKPIDIDPNVADIVEPITDRSGIIVLPDEWRDGLARPDVLRSQRDTRLDEVRAELVEWLERHPQDDGPEAHEVAKWRSPRRFAALVGRWNDTPPVGDGVPDLLARANDWQQWDRRTWGHQEHGRDKHLSRRRDAWRRVAAWLSNSATTIVVDDSNLARIARQDFRQEGVPAEVAKLAARQRVDASPGGLRADIVAAAKRDKRDVISVKSTGLSSTCPKPKCRQTKNSTDDGHEIECKRCGHRYDRDTVATLLMLERARGES